MQVRARLKRHAKRAILAALGRPLRCELCHGELATVVPVTWRGEVKLIGVERGFVAVDFASMNRLVFRHAQAGACPAQRP